MKTEVTELKKNKKDFAGSYLFFLHPVFFPDLLLHSDDTKLILLALFSR